MTAPRRIHHDLYRGPKVLTDPGNGGTIQVSKDLQICEMVSTTTETRTLANPTKSGIRFVLRMLTDGGDIVVTASNGFNTALEVSATFADAGDMLSLISVQKSAGVYRWQVLDGQIGAGIASSSSTATATGTSTTTASATSTSTGTGTSTSTATKSATSTTTGTSTATTTTTGTKTGSPTATTTGTATSTSTSTASATTTTTGSATSTSTGTGTSTSTSTGTATASATGTQ